jgi:hypothetical protein
LKRQEDRLTTLEVDVSLIKEEKETFIKEERLDSLKLEIATSIELLETKVTQLSDDLQSKTNDLYEELQDLN